MDGGMTTAAATANGGHNSASPSAVAALSAAQALHGNGSAPLAATALSGTTSGLNGNAPLSLELQQKVASAYELLVQAVAEFGSVAYANSLGAEAMVLTDLIWSKGLDIEVFSIDTGRLHEET